MERKKRKIGWLLVLPLLGILYYFRNELKQGVKKVSNDVNGVTMEITPYMLSKIESMKLSINLGENYIYNEVGNTMKYYSLSDYNLFEYGIGLISKDKLSYPEKSKGIADLSLRQYLNIALTDGQKAVLINRNKMFKEVLDV